ncbi:MAG TPA: type II secretion system F family protein, partial [Candidatus Saccharimonadales bacterium]|nr:type II secretion system F family protein [Candidatus Saccharimonadales bacterium]
KEGKSLADGLASYPKTFSNIYIQLVRAGEASGKLEVILERLTDYLQRTEETRKKVSKAFSGPIFQLVMIAGAVIAIMTLIIPQLKPMLKSAGKEMPWLTQMLLTGSEILLNHYLIILMVLLAIGVAFQYWKSRPEGKRTLDALKLKIPIVRFFARTSAVVQFSGTLGMLIESGVNLSQALDIVCNIIDNSILVDKLKEAKDKIIKQGKISPFLKETGLFPPMAIYLINTGEQSGKLDFMLLTVARNYEVELNDFTDSLTSKLDPIMTIVMGCVIGLVMFAIMGPMMSLYQM